MSEQTKDCSGRLLEITADIKKIIRYMKRKHYFSTAYGIEDLFQEVFLRLMVQVPQHYSEEKGEFVPYCVTAAYNLLLRLSYKHKVEQGFIQLPDETASASPWEAYDMMYRESKCKHRNERLSALAKIEIEDLIKLDKKYRIVKLLYEKECQRDEIREESGKSNSWITSRINKLRQDKEVINRLGQFMPIK